MVIIKYIDDNYDQDEKDHDHHIDGDDDTKGYLTLVWWM